MVEKGKTPNNLEDARSRIVCCYRSAKVEVSPESRLRQKAPSGCWPRVLLTHRASSSSGHESLRYDGVAAGFPSQRVCGATVWPSPWSPVRVRRTPCFLGVRRETREKSISTLPAPRHVVNHGSGVWGSNLPYSRAQHTQSSVLRSSSWSSL